MSTVKLDPKRDPRCRKCGRPVTHVAFDNPVFAHTHGHVGPCGHVSGYTLGSVVICPRCSGPDAEPPSCMWTSDASAFDITVENQPRTISWACGHKRAATPAEAEALLARCDTLDERDLTRLSLATPDLEEW